MKKFLTDDENKRLIEQIKSDISIVDYGTKLGFTPVRTGAYYSFKEHDSVRIDPNRNIYFRNSRDTHKGSIIDFVIEFQNGINTFHEAMIELTSKNHTYLVKNTPKSNNYKYDVAHPKKEFILPDRDDNVCNVYAYLIKTRKIDKQIVSDLISKGYIKQDKFKNCLFIGYDGDPKDNNAVIACLRGTNTKKPFKIDVAGSNYEKGFYIDNGSDVVVITESFIDAMSYMTLSKLHGKDPYKYDYLPLASVNKDMSIYNRLKNPRIKSAVLCLDNDEAGIKASRRIKENISKFCPVKVIFPSQKDLNDSLCNSPSKPFKMGNKNSIIIENIDKKIEIEPPISQTSSFDYSL